MNINKEINKFFEASNYYMMIAEKAEKEPTKNNLRIFTEVGYSILDTADNLIAVISGIKEHKDVLQEMNKFSTNLREALESRDNVDKLMENDI